MESVERKTVEITREMDLDRAPVWVREAFKGNKINAIKELRADVEHKRSASDEPLSLRHAKIIVEEFMGRIRVTQEQINGEDNDKA